MIKSKLTKYLLLFLMTLSLMMFVVVSLSDNTENTVKAQSQSITIENSASVRLEGKSGLRFTATVDRSYYDGLDSESKKAGIIVIPQNLLEGELTVQTDKVLNIEKTVWYEQPTAEHYKFSGVITDIPETDYGTALTARAYLFNGSDYVYSSETVTRSVAQVASYALKEGESSEILLNYVDKAVKKFQAENNSYSIYLAEKVTPKISVEPSDLSVAWESMDESIAVVDKTSGEITAKGVGNTEIKAKLGSGEIIFNLEVKEGKIGYFDSELGVEQLYLSNAEAKFTTKMRYGDEAGSTEFTLLEGSNGLYATMDKQMVQKDVSDYDYMIFRLYNPNDFEMWFVYDEWFGFTNCPSGVWTEVKIPVTDIVSSDYPSRTIKSLEDITGLVFKVGKPDYTTEPGMKFYMSALMVIKGEYGFEPVEGKIGYFDSEFGASQLTPSNAVIKYNSDIKYENENGSTEITLLEGSNGLYATMDKNMVQKDITGYDYIVFRLYNPNDYDMVFLYGVWFGLTQCPANSWTEIKVPVEAITGQDGSDTITGLDDITGLVFKTGKSDYSVETGMKFYMSALWAVKESV